MVLQHVYARLLGLSLHLFDYSCQPPLLSSSRFNGVAFDHGILTKYKHKKKYRNFFNFITCTFMPCLRIIIM